MKALGVAKELREGESPSPSPIRSGIVREMKRMRSERARKFIFSARRGER
jgi:hypothetical protein